MAPFTRRLAGAATVCAILAAALFGLAGCGGPPGAEAPPSTYEAAPAPVAPPELAGGPVSPPSQELAGGPPAGSAAEPALPPTPPGLTTWRERDGRLVTAMEAIPNPEAASPAEPQRAPIDRYAEQPRREFARIPGAHPQPRQAHRSAPVVAARSAPPRAPQPALKTAPPLAKPVTVAPSTPVVAAKPPTPKASLKTATPSAPLQTPGQRLATVLSAQTTSGSTFTVPAVLAQGQPGEVTLSLPTTLLGAIQGEAAKIGLGRAARSTDVVATLSGDGYEITPNGAQTAALKPGEAATFTWQVKPGAGAKTPLKAQVDGVLAGLRNPIPFPLATLERAVAPASAPASKLPSFGFLPNGMLAIPGVGSLPARSVIGAALVLLAVIVLAILARNAEAERERAALRRRRALANAQTASAEEVVVEPPPPPPASTGGHVAPLVAAAAVGAVAATAVARHQQDAQPGPFPTEQRSTAAPGAHDLPPAEPLPPVQDAAAYDKPVTAPDGPANPAPTSPPRPEQLH